MKVISYSRVSTEDQSERGFSLEAQQEKIKAYANVYDLEIVATVVDPGESGKTLNRPGIQKALAMLRSGEADGLVIIKLDRLTRELADWPMLMTYFGPKGGKQLFSVGNMIDTRSATGRMVLNIELTVAQFEREVIAERTKAALEHKIRAGQRVGNVRYGYDLADDRRTLIPNADEQATIQLMKNLRAEGLSYAKIAKQLTDHSVPTKEGGVWAPSSVRRILKRPQFVTQHDAIKSLMNKTNQNVNGLVN